MGLTLGGFVSRGFLGPEESSACLGFDWDISRWKLKLQQAIKRSTSERKLSLDPFMLAQDESSRPIIKGGVPSKTVLNPHQKGTPPY